MKIKNIQRVISAIEEEIDYLINSCRTGSSFKTYEESAKVTEKNLKEKTEKITKLIDIKFTLRNIVKRFNVSKIDEKTAEIAKVEEQLSFYKTLVGFNQPNPTYDRNSYSSGVTATFNDEARDELKRLTRKKQSLKDSCAGINSSGEVELSGELVSLLKEFNLID